MQTDRDRQLAANNEKKRTQSQQMNLTQENDLILSQQNSMDQQFYEHSSQMQDQSQQIAQNQEIQQQQQGNDDYEYGEYQQYDENGEYMIEQPLHNFQRMKSTEKNTQCSMEHLIRIIQKDTQRVMLLAGFDRYWASILYQVCNWKMTNVQNLIDQKLSSHKIVNYKPTTAQIVTLEGQCDVCCQENQTLIKNLCGHQFCLLCWKDYLKQRMETFYLDPFPTCLDETCKTKTSPFILEIISLNDESFKKLYLRTLCRGYAVGNNSVKVCKGRQGKSCDQCFNVYKLLERLQCDNCGNILCAKCGQDYHSPCECFEKSNWRNIVENSTNFMGILDFKTCPNCYQGVQKSIGCNSVVCKCQTMFCYICGQRWHPNHSKHGYCYRSEEIQALRKERKKKTDNNKQYTQNLEKNKEKIDTFNYKIKEIKKINGQNLKSEIMERFKILSNQLDYVVPLLKTLQVALMSAKGYVIALHFNESQTMKVKQNILQNFIKNAYDFLVYELPVILEAFSEKPIVSKKALKLRNDNINPQDQLSKCRLLMVQSMSNIEKYIRQ